MYINFTIKYLYKYIKLYYIMVEEKIDNDFEIVDVENYRDTKDQQFSHQVLVMKVMTKCIEAGIQEMRVGYFNEKADRFGNKSMIYYPDTRKEFIESVKTAEMIMICDYDDEAKTKIKNIKERLTKEYKQLVETEKKDWETLSITNKRARWSKGIFYTENTLNVRLPYYQEYLEYEVQCYRDIFSELTKLTERLGFYEATGLMV